MIELERKKNVKLCIASERNNESEEQLYSSRNSQVFLKEKLLIQLSHVMRQPVYAICEQQRRRSACASAQSDQRLCSLPR